MKGKKVLFTAIAICLAATMVWASPATEARTQAADISITALSNTQVATPVDTKDRNIPAPKITYEQAAKIALDKVGGGYVKEIDLEYKHRYGGLVYEVDVRKDYAEYDVYVDAETGEVLRVKID